MHVRRCERGIKAAFNDTDTDTDTDMDFLAHFLARVRVREVGVSGARRSRRGGRGARRNRPAAPRRARPVQLADLSADFCPTRALFLARMAVGDARVYTCTSTVHDKLSCTRLQNYTIGASLNVTVGVRVRVGPVGFQL